MEYYIITGTSRGIGAALVEELLKRDDVDVTGVARGEGIQHSKYHHKKFDLSELDQVLKFEFHGVKSAKRVVLINNAGTLGDVAHSGSLNDAEMASAYVVNLIAPAVLTNKFIASYKDLDAEKIIINISSGAAQREVDGWSVYCSSKAGIDMLTRVVATEQELDNGDVRIFAVAPGIVDTQMQTEIRDQNEQDFSGVSRFREYKSSGALSSPEDVASRLIKWIDDGMKSKDVVLRLE